MKCPLNSIFFSIKKHFSVPLINYKLWCCFIFIFIFISYFTFLIGFVSFLDRCLDLLTNFNRALTEKEEKEVKEDDEDEDEDDTDRNNKADSRKSKHGNHLTECLSNCAGMLQ